MEEIIFEVKEDFSLDLERRFTAFITELKQPKIVVLDIESKGGFVKVLRSMEAQITVKKKEGFVFVTNVDNYAYSAGFLLFLLGDIRFTTDTAGFMYHPAGFTIENKRVTTENLKQMAELLEVEDEFVYKIFKENTQISAELFDVIKKNDVFLTKKDLKNLNLIN